MIALSALLSVRDLRHRYGERVVLDIPALDVQSGELLALVGPSGAGKSTLLRLLNYLESPTEGRVLFDGQSYDAASVPLSLRRRMVTVFQRPLLLDTSVRRNVGMGLRLRGRRNTADAVDKALASVGLSALADARARTLSAGEAQRVTLARALVLEPDVIFLDEPTANLDPTNVRIIEELLADIHRQRGVTIVLVTHHVWQARRLAERVALLLDGQLLEIAATADFFERPQDPRTGAFLRGELVY